MLFHTYLIGDLAPGWTWLSRYGWMGVDLFFVLSGFLIGTQVLAPLARGERLRFGDFYLRRALRILPAFWVMLALYLWWPAIREVPRMEPCWKFVFFLFNVTADYRNPAFSQIWSLCVEEHFYLVFPLLAGPFFLPVLLGNLTANVLRSIWTFVIIFCGHFTADAEVFPKESIRNESRGHWYLRQLRGSSNLTGGKLMNVLSGNLSHQI
ncbi:acyltransferase, partial [Xanthomonas sp. Kuri4-3]